MFGSDGEDEFGFGVVYGDGAGRDRLVSLHGFGKGEAEGAVIELLGDEFGLVVGVCNRFDVSQLAETVSDRADAAFFAFDLCERVDSQGAFAQVKAYGDVVEVRIDRG